MEQTGVALGALAGEGLEAAGLTALGAGTLPLSGAVGGALLTAAAIGAVTGVGTGALGSLQGRLVTGVHWMGDELRHLAHNAGALGAQEVGIDARPAAMDLQRRSAVGRTPWFVPVRPKSTPTSRRGRRPASWAKGTAERTAATQAA